MTFDQFFRILRARWLLALSVMGALVVITMGICLWLPKSYKATASVMVDLKPDPVAGMAAAAGARRGRGVDPRGGALRRRRPHDPPPPAADATEGGLPLKIQ